MHMLRLDDVKATLGDIVSGLKMCDDEVRQVCRIPLRVIALDVDGDVLKALHLGPLHSAIFRIDGELSMPWLKQVAVPQGAQNCRLRVAFADGSSPVDLPTCDLTRIVVKPMMGYLLELTAVARATLTPSQLTGLYRLQPYVDLRATITGNQDALSLVEA